ncbi:hypothetical protein [Amycolatopsis vastitatis]|uniref:Uncharacterized protein n=1 Tax=Amycolatopsis vastitatis TaxID=1905142 RepID=A0A229T1P6_9PSEU|nr:hypothetical protein [Amycolatopsis vastitatis]OXM64834.1 hypothetical protein CF165_25440 [Amycolatopsis vastitatis]
MFDELVAEAEAVSVDGWDFSWLDGRPSLPPLMVATESWPPNIGRASARLRPRGAVVVATADFPFRDNRDKLRELYEKIERDGPFVAHTTRFLIEARKP